MVGLSSFSIGDPLSWTKLGQGKRLSDPCYGAFPSRWAFHYTG